MSEIKEEVIGRWDGIFNSLGITTGDGRHTACPVCRDGKDRFRYDNIDGKGTWICNQCGAGDGWSLLMKVLGVDFKEAIKSVEGVIGTVDKVNMPKEKKMSKETLNKVFCQSKPISEKDPAHKYLKSRGLTNIPHCLRYSNKCWESETKENQKALLAVFHCQNGSGVTIHRIYLDADGNKLDIKSPKKSMPPLQSMNGGAVRLFKITDGTLGVAEGIETAIAASEDLGIPTWACLTANGMETFVVPREVKHLVVISDNDENYTGQKAAYTLANRVKVNDKIAVSVYTPTKKGYDWLDQFVEQKSK